MELLFDILKMVGAAVGIILVAGIVIIAVWVGIEAILNLINRRGGKLFGLDYRGGAPSGRYVVDDAVTNLDRNDTSEPIKDIFRVVKCFKYRKEESQKHIGEEVECIGKGNDSYLCTCSDGKNIVFSHAELKTVEGFPIKHSIKGSMSLIDITIAERRHKDVWLLRKDSDGSTVAVGALIIRRSDRNATDEITVKLSLLTTGKAKVVSKKINVDQGNCNIFEKLYGKPPKGVRIVDYLPKH
jgi:hypothetical protein